MTLSMPEPLTSWDRHLPTPAALLQNMPSSGRGKSRHSFHPHLPSDQAPKSLFGDFAWRRRSVSSISLVGEAKVDAAQRTDDLSLTVTDAARGARLHSTHKRSASIMTDEPTARDRTLSTPSTGEAAQQFCLCQPDPKIPRPRNAFILYRQHQQAAVAAQNPGLPNPDISKIIGEQWRSLPAKSKNEWKALAEEEKARHQQQYPDYRYQPRRNGRYSNRSSVSSPSPTTATSAQGTCLKCGGKMMNPPSTPYTAYPLSATAAVQQQMVGMPPPQRSYIVNNAPLNRSRVTGSVAPPPQSARARPYPEVFGRSPPSHDPRVRHPQALPESIPMSPDLKRRRFNGNGGFAPIREHPPAEAYQYSPRMIPVTHYEAVPPPPHHPQAVVRPMYAAPPPPPQLQPARPRRPVSSPHDPNLILPPLKSITTTDPSHAVRQPSTHSHVPEERKPSTSQTTQTSGLEAMIRSIPVLNKLKIIRQISPSLRSPGLSSPAYEVRGAIVAIEGLDDDCVADMTRALAERLGRDFCVRVFEGPRLEGSAKEITAQGFLGLIGRWHAVSREVVDFITTKPVRDDALGGKNMEMEGGEVGKQTDELEKSNDRHKSVAGRREDSVDHDAISPRTITKTAALSLASPAPNITTFPTVSSVPQTRSHSTTSRPRPAKGEDAHFGLIPVALIPHYQLSTVDVASMAMPITDAYSPLSHWQWLATLWRGCVGADVSVVIEPGGVDGERGVHGAGAGAGAGDVGVEVRLKDAGAVVVRIGEEVGVDRQKVGREFRGDGEGWEKAVRRVGFEVDEFLRK